MMAHHRPRYVALYALGHVDICDEVKSCRRNGGVECNTTNETCPPCIYTLQDKFTCWEKNNVTNTCPFTGVKYDCSTAWSTQLNNANTTDTTTTTEGAATDNSQLIKYGAMGGGALLLVIILIVFVLRRRRRRRNMPQFGLQSPPGTFNTKRAAKSANTPYAHVPPTRKGAHHSHHHNRRLSDPVILESSAVNVSHEINTQSSAYSGLTASTDSMDAMLNMNTPPTAVLGDPLPRNRSKRGISNKFQRHNSNGSNRTDKSNHSAREAPPAPATHYHPHAAPHNNNHNSANVLDEYLKMKEEMQFDVDVMSDYGGGGSADMMSSMDRFSVASASTMGGADSEYYADLMRSRTESECYSEMSYNDEKYSFSEEDPDLSASAAHAKLDREIEI